MEIFCKVRENYNPGVTHTHTHIVFSVKMHVLAHRFTNCVRELKEGLLEDLVSFVFIDFTYKNSSLSLSLSLSPLSLFLSTSIRTCVVPGLPIRRRTPANQR
jgi:hypothetical protein